MQVCTNSFLNYKDRLISFCAAYYIIIIASVLGVFLFFLSAFVPPITSYYIRQKIDSTLYTPRAQFENNNSKLYGAAFSGFISTTKYSLNKNNLNTNNYHKTTNNRALLTPSFENIFVNIYDDNNYDHTVFFNSELRSYKNTPERWEIGESQFSEKFNNICDITYVSLDSNLAKATYFSNKFSKGSVQYLELIKNYSEQFNLRSALVLAIMKTESNFNHLAISKSNAVGLMQIVPSTAGEEVHKFLTGVREQPSEEFLFSPETNILYGTAYLHLLEKTYFAGVENSDSKKICVIAAYNGGPGAVLRVFSRYSGESIKIINSLSPEDVYDILTTEMPTEESRKYISVVLGHYYSYLNSSK